MSLQNAAFDKFRANGINRNINKLICSIVLLLGMTACTADPTSQAVSAPPFAIDMADIPAGAFIMGSDRSAGLLVGTPKHEVKLPAFRISRYDITFAQYDAFAIAAHRALPGDEGWGREQRPVINVSWQDIQDFIAWLNQQTSRHFRLPSEAEWEYALRAGTSTTYWWGNEANSEYMNTQLDTGRDKWLYSSPVGEFIANPNGLFDMSGNVWQRVADCYHSNFEGAPADGRVWNSTPCNARVIRGGSWYSVRMAAQSTARSAMADNFRSAAVGFRLAEDAHP